MEQSDISLVDKIKKKFKNERIEIVAADSRKEYYELLNRARIVVSLKTEETFGLGQLEAYVLGSIPLCPKDYSYPEVVGDIHLLYSSEESLMYKLEELLKLKINPFQINPFQIDIEKYEQTISECMKFVNNEEN